MRKGKYDVILVKNSIERKELERDIQILSGKKIESLKIIEQEDNKIQESNQMLKERKAVPSHLLKISFDDSKKQKAMKDVSVIEIAIEKLKRQYEILEEKEKSIKELMNMEVKEQEKKLIKKQENEMISFRRHNQ